MPNNTSLNNTSTNYDNAQAGVSRFNAPYIGIVKNNVDPTRSGRLDVFIPELCDPGSVINVSYASPFFGATKATVADFDAFSFEKQTYGFWACPPDLENKVLITFVAGDLSRGYWFACIPDAESKHMLPGVARQPGKSLKALSQLGDNRGLADDNVFLPASEVNTNDREASKDQNLLNLDRIVHLPQSEVVLRQGLETDPIRGTITSSSMRESPSRVFGFSTPGRPFTEPTVDSFKSMSDPDKEAIDAIINDPEIKTDNIVFNNPQGRKGGHTLVMDDGDIYGDNNLVRLRTAGGHTLLMHDTENIIYITNKQGNAWIELTPTGAINVYGAKSYSLRSEADINLHADANVNIHAGDSINCFAQERIETETHTKREKIKFLHNIDTGNFGLHVDNQMRIKTLNGHVETERFLRIHSGTTSGWTVKSGEMQLTGGSDIHLNTAGKSIRAPENPERNALFEQFQKQDVFFDPVTERWIIDDRTEFEFESISPFTPTHEPWSRETGPQKLNSGTLKETKQQKDE